MSVVLSNKDNTFALSGIFCQNECVKTIYNTANYNYNNQRDHNYHRKDYNDNIDHYYNYDYL